VIVQSYLYRHEIGTITVQSGVADISDIILILISVSGSSVPGGLQGGHLSSLSDAGDAAAGDHRAPQLQPDASAMTVSFVDVSPSTVICAHLKHHLRDHLWSVPTRMHQAVLTCHLCERRAAMQSVINAFPAATFTDASAMTVVVRGCVAINCDLRTLMHHLRHHFRSGALRKNVPRTLGANSTVSLTNTPAAWYANL
jgi:hypothetical protein